MQLANLNATPQTDALPMCIFRANARVWQAPAETSIQAAAAEVRVAAASLSGSRHTGTAAKGCLHLGNTLLPEMRTASGFTQSLTGMSTVKFLGSRAWPVRRADNLTAICEPTV
jgi:hypothetical protein